MKKVDIQLVEPHISIEIGGGIRSVENIKAYLNIGVDKVILGSAAIKNPNFLKKACEEFKDKIALGLDASIDDPLAFLSITTEGFYKIGEIIGSSQLPTILIQEGGYISNVLGDNLAAVLKGFEQQRDT